MKSLVIFFASFMCISCDGRELCDATVLNKYVPTCLHLSEVSDPMCRSANFQKIQDITAELGDDSGSFVKKLKTSKDSQTIFYHVKDRFGVFLLNEAIVLNELDAFEFILSQGVSPFTVEGPTSAAFNSIIMQNNYEFVRIVKKYYPISESDDTVQLVKYFSCRL